MFPFPNQEHFKGHQVAGIKHSLKSGLRVRSGKSHPHYIKINNLFMGQPVLAISPKVLFCGCCGEDGIDPIAAIHEMDLEIYLLFCGGPGGLSGFQCVDVTVYAHSVAPIAASNRSPAPHASNVKVRSLGSEDAHQTNVCWHNKTSIFEDLG